MGAFIRGGGRFSGGRFSSGGIVITIENKGFFGMEKMVGLKLNRAKF